MTPQPRGPEGPPRVLVVDDEVRFRRLVASILEHEGYDVREAADGAQALEQLAGERFDLVLSDVRMPGMDGVQLLKEVKRTSTATRVILMTAYATADTAVEALRAGVQDYLIKPFEMRELRRKVRQLLPFAAGAEGMTSGGAAAEKKPPLSETTHGMVVGSSPAMRQVLSLAALVADSDASVLLLGETGTGKGMLARAIHEGSARAGKRLVEIHCAALPETLLESELFGHEKGAFTGAVARKIGQLESAHGGTIFLDEIGEVPLAVQVKLLRFLQSRDFVRVGGMEVQRVDTRVIAATHRDLGAAIAEGTFREDLFYRLNVFPIRLPSLRERREDIPLLVAHLLERAKAPDDAVAPEAMGLLMGWRWPGNVRELENVIERCLIVARGGRIRAEHLPAYVIARAEGPSVGGAPPTGSLGALLGPNFDLDTHVRDLILEALRQADGNKAEAARRLGITRRRIYSMMKSLAIEGAEEP